MAEPAISSAKQPAIDPSATFGDDVVIDVERLEIGAGAVLGAGVRLRGDEVRLGAGARIGARTSVNARRFHTGYRTSVGEDCTIAAVGGAAEEIDLGDNSLIGAFSTILVPRLVLGDFVAIHHHTLVNGYKPCVVGHNTWIGQNCVLNCTDTLTIGNSVGIGAYSSIYTHAYNGELLEGCQLWNVAPVVIEDNAWLVGCYNVVSPGVTVGARGTILTGSVVSKDVPELHVVAGVPAKDLTDRVTVFTDISLDEKLELMRRFIREFAEALYPGRHEEVGGGVRVSPERRDPFRLVVAASVAEVDTATGEEVLAYVRSHDGSEPPMGVTVFDVSSKLYTKRSTDAVIETIRFMNGYRARFAPADRPRVVATSAG